MAVIGIGIVLLILRSQYKKEQKASARKGLKVLAVLQTIFTAFEFFAFTFLLLSTAFNKVLELFVEIFLKEILDYFPYTGNALTNFVTVVLWIAILYKIIIMIFGIVTLSMGFSTVSNKEWTENALSNQQQVNMRPRQNSNINTAQTAKHHEWYCSCGTANQSNANFCPVCGKKNPNN